MAECKRCKKRGLFLRVNSNGLCNSCVQLEAAETRKKLEDQQKRLEEERIRRETERKRLEEQRRREKYAAYDAMVGAIEDYPISTSEKPAKKMAASFINELKFSSVTKKSDITKLGDFVVIDTETTGLKYSSDEIIDIAAIRFRDFQPTEKFSTLLKPHHPIPEKATAINHITDEMVSQKPYFQDIAESLVAFIGDDNIVGHNLPFDLKFIVHYGADVTTQKRKYYDTLSIAQKTIKKVRMKWDREFEEYIEDPNSYGISDYKLNTLCAWYAIINKDKHRAEGDALAAGLLFQKLVEERIEK